MEIIQTIGPVIVLALLLIFLAVRAYMDKEGQKEMKKFLNSLTEKMEGIIVDYLDDIDFKDFHNLAEIEAKIIESIYNQIWQMTIDALENSAQTPLIKMLIKKYLTKENVENFIKYIFETERVQLTYTGKYNKALLAASNINTVTMNIEDIERLEKETVEENKKYETESVQADDVVNWAEKAMQDYPDGSDQSINPAIEDAENIPVSDNDSTVEEV